MKFPISTKNGSPTEKTLINNLLFSKNKNLHGIEHFSLSFGGITSDNYQLKVYGELLPEGEKRLALFAFSEAECIGRICPRMDSPQLLKRFGLHKFGEKSMFIGWIPAFGLPEKFEINLYAGTAGSFGLGANIHQGNKLKSCTFLGKITGTKTFINQKSSKYTPIKLVCFGRSGSSLAMRLLSYHPQIAVTGSHPYEFEVAKHYFSRGKVLSQNCVDFFDEQLLNNRKARPQQNPWYQYERVQWMGGDRVENFFAREQIGRNIDFCRDSVDGFFESIKPTDSRLKMYFCEKEGSGLSGFDTYKEVWPSAKRVFLVRDFRDNCASILSYCQKKGEKEFGMQYFDTTEEWIMSLSAKAKDMLEVYRSDSSDDVFVFYEHLMNEREGTLKKLFTELGLQSDNSTISAIMKRDTKEGKNKRISVHKTSDSFQASIGRWKSDLPQHLVDLIDSEFSEVMEAFGYQ